MGKIEKKIDEQNGNISKEIENLKGNKKNSGSGKSSNWNERLIEWLKSRFQQAEE